MDWRESLQSLLGKLSVLRENLSRDEQQVLDDLLLRRDDEVVAHQLFQIEKQIEKQTTRYIIK